MTLTPSSQPSSALPPDLLPEHAALTHTPHFDIADLGTLPYQAAWNVQHALHAKVAAGGRPTLLLVEHPPVLTLGRKARAGENIMVTREYLAGQGIEVLEVERGGDVTYHGPGQLVAYAIFPVGRRVRDFLRLLENATVDALHALGLPDARPNPGYAGVYVAPREIGGLERQQKIASIGVAVKKDVALHGIGLNIATNLRHFDLIVPCGLTDTQMTSVAREYGLRRQAEGAELQAGQQGATMAATTEEAAALMQQAKTALAGAFEGVFAGYDFSLPALHGRETPPADLPTADGLKTPATPNAAEEPTQ